MKLVVTSDTHFFFPKTLIPEGDVFIHCGDALYAGTSGEWFDFVQSLDALPHKVKLFMPGNHDLWYQYFQGPCDAELRQAGCQSLYGRPFTLENGWRVGGVPYVSNLPAWAFNRDEEAVQKELDALAPLDILVTHAPPRGLLDAPEGHRGHYGLGAIRRYIEKYRPQYHFFGHVHERYGSTLHGRTELYNVAMCNEDYKQVNPPLVLEIP